MRFDFLYNWLRLKQYQDDPVQREFVRTLALISLLGIPVALVVIFNAIFFSPAEDLPADLLLVFSAAGGTLITLFLLRRGYASEAVSALTTFLIISASAQIFYEPPSFSSLSFYWVIALFIGLYSRTELQMSFALGAISVIWTLAYIYDAEPGTGLDSLAYRLTVMWAIGFGSRFLVENVRVQSSERGREEARAEAHRRITMMQVSGEVLSNTFARRDLQEVLERAVEDIREFYEQVYHAQVFLINESRDYAELRASTGDIGNQLIARGHKLAVGSQSVIGQVTATKRPVVAQSEATDTVHKRNELLPNTRTELALPLLVNQNLIGVLDLQSQQSDAFSQDDIEVFQVLADQIALAIDNASLITQLRDQSDENARLLNAEKRNRALIESYNRELAGQAWSVVESSLIQQQINLKTGQMSPLPDISERAKAIFASGDMQVDPTDGPLHYVSLPIKINGIVVGVLEFEVPRADLPAPELMGTLRVLSDRLGRTAENIRLFQQTQEALTEVERLYQVAQVANFAGDASLEDVYAAVIEQLVYDEQLSTVAVLMAHPLPSVYTSHLTVSYLWQRVSGSVSWAVGQQLDYLRRGFAAYFELAPNMPHYFDQKPIARGPEAQVTEDLMTALNAQSLFLMPIVLGEKWFGVLVCASERLNGLSERFRNFVQAAANQLALTIDNRRLFEEAQKEAQRAFVLAETGQQVAELRGDVQAKIGRLFRALAGPAEFNYWWLGTIDPSHPQIVRRIESHIPDDRITIEMPNAVNFATDDNSIVEAMQVAQVILVNDPEDSQSMLNTWKSQFGKHVVVPIESATEKVIGALLLGRYAEVRDFDERDVQFVTTFATQLAVAFENQRLFEEVENQRRLYNEVLAALPTGVVVFNADTSVQLVNEQARAIMGHGIEAGLFAPNTYPLFDATNDTRYQADSFPALVSIQQGLPTVPQTFYVVRDDSRRIDILLNTATIRDDAGEIASTVVTLQDISELRELEGALQSSLSETTALYEASRSIAEAATKDELVNAIIEQINSVNPDHTYLLFREGQDEDALHTAVVGISSRAELNDLNLSIEQLPLPSNVLMSEEVMIVEDIVNAPLSPNDIAAIQAANIAAFATFPLVARGERIIGWFVLAYALPHAFLSEERRFLSTLSAQAAVALDVLRLFESAQITLRSLSKLYRGNRRTASSRSSFEAADVVREELLSFAPDRIDIVIQRGAEDFERLESLLTWAHERSLEDIPALPIDPVTLQAQANYDLLDETPVFIEDMTQEPANTLHRALRAIDTAYQTVISTPLRVSGRTIGRLGMGFLQPRTFSNDDRQFVEILSDSLAFVVSNEQLFSQTQDSLEETGVLYQASRAIVNAESREEVLHSMIDYAASANVDKVMLIRLITPAWDSLNALVEVTTTWGRGDFLDLKGLRFTPVQLPIWDKLASEEITFSDNIDDDDTIDEFTKLGFRTLDIASFVVVPLRTANRAVGAIMLGSSSPRQHTEREIRIYSSLADQASITLENMTLLEQADIRTRQLEISAQVSQSATQILNLDELFPKIVSQIKESFNYDHAQIFLIDDQGENAVLKAATGEAGRQMLALNHSLPVGSPSVVGQATSTGQPFLVSDTSEQGVMHRPNPYLPDTRAELAVPLRVKGAIVGALDVQSNQPGTFGGEDIAALTSLADQLAIAIENARLFEVSMQRADDMSFLFDITSTAASASGSLDETLETLATVLIRQMKSQAVELFLKVTDQDVLQSQVLIVGKGTPNGLEYQFVDADSTIPLGLGLVGWVGRHLRPIIINDFEQEQEYLPAISTSRSGIFVPLSIGADLIGVIAIEGTRPYQYDEEDLRLLMTLSSTLTPIIQNVLLVDELQRTNDRLREVDQLKTNFLASMSHELRTPLNSIIGFSRVILKGIDGPITDMQSQDIQTIHDSGKHLLGLVNDILDQAKIEAGKMELVKEYFDLTAVVKSLMATAQGLTKDKPIQLFSEIGNNLPYAYGDEFRTRQIILNVLGNAAKFTYEGSITVSVYLDEFAPKARTMLVVSVTDTGIGIDEKDLPKIFESFQQVDSTTTRSAEGTGLGLPLANSFAMLQGGGIEVESEVGTGSTFSIYVPIEPTEEDLETVIEPDVMEAVAKEHDTGPLRAADTDETLPKRPTQELRRRVILVVDDEVGTINLYRRYLSKEGWQVIGETDAMRTEEMVTAHAPQMILLDINMPNRQGWDVLEKIRTLATSADIPVIVCSVETDTHRSAALGAQIHIVKPIEEQTLLDAVKTIERDYLSTSS